MPRKAAVGQRHAPHYDVVGTNLGGRFESRRPDERDQIVLVNSISGNADRTDEYSAFVEREPALEDGDAVRQTGQRSTGARSRKETGAGRVEVHVELQPRVKDAP